MHTSEYLGIIGALLLLGLGADAVGRRTRLPRVTLLLMLGLAIGPDGLAFLPEPSQLWFSLAADLALVMVGFLLGAKFTTRMLRAHGRQVLWISAGVTLASALAVAGGLALFGVPLDLALLLGGIATATDPAATIDVVEEAGTSGPFSRTLLGIVAVDDAWGLILFSLLLAAAAASTGPGDLAGSLTAGLRDVGGAVALGAALGVPAAYLTGRVDPGEPSLLEALGLLLL
ncbi:MAG: cation:proton antiporter, partial [Myxococcales bacterium]|nr:cation:proton antiporter [Myxococcales bacterium]